MSMQKTKICYYNTNFHLYTSYVDFSIYKVNINMQKITYHAIGNI
jgi:hypothetical protein